MQKLKVTPFLTDEEEYTSAKEWKENQDPKALSRLVESHLKLVIKIAKGYSGYGLPLEDLVAEGNIGILQATKKFDYEKGFKFSTYAQWWIRASIQEYILGSWSLVKMGTTAAQKKLFFNLRKMKNKLDKEDQNTFLSDEKISKISIQLDVKPEEVKQMHQRMFQQDSSLNAPLSQSDEGESEWIEWVCDDKETHEEEILNSNESHKQHLLFEQAFKKLKPREQYILSARRLHEEPRKLEDLALELNLSRERIRQIENAAFDKIRKFVSTLIQENDIHF
jgi:RNA polymerase sigma-32 factor